MEIGVNAATKLAEPAPPESLCESCGRRWFGLVAYCPYCGRQSSFATQEPGNRPVTDGVFTSAALALVFIPVVVVVIAVLLFWIGAKLLAPGTKQEAAPSAPRSTSGVVVSPMPTQGPTQGSTQGRMQGPTQGPSTGAAPAPARAPAPPPAPAAKPGATQGPASGRSTGAAPAPSSPPRSDTAVPAPPNRSPLCSVADEAAGLCRSQ
jgi:hypothetical protein